MLCGIPPFYSKDKEQLYRNIKFVEPKLDYPYMSENAKDLCRLLLEKDPAHRLGNTLGGVQLIKEHPWFENINWTAIQNKRITPPYVPQLDSGIDTKHFPKEFTGMKLSPQDVQSLKDVDGCNDDASWNGFSYVNS